MTMALLQFINLEEILGNTPGRTWMDKSTCFCKIVIIFRADLVQAVYRQGGGLAVPGSDHGRHHRLHHRLGSVILQASTVL